MTELRIGGARVARVEESYEPNFDARRFFPDWDPAELERHRGWMVPDHFDPVSGMLKLSMHSWLIQIGGKNVLIDACVGNHKPRAVRPQWHEKEWPYLERLRDAGVSPADIHMVMCTHLHVDHVGWNTRLDNGRWVPTFPTARYVFSHEEYNHHLAVDRDPARGPANYGAFRDSVLPVVEAGLGQLVAGAAEIDEHFSVQPAPGHTPGTVAIHCRSKGSHALFCGDILHHMIQVYRPEWSSFACADAEQSRRSRRRVLEECAGSGAVLLPAHFGAPHYCRIESAGAGFVPRLGG